ncbi:MAG: PEP-CTERM sorting domain-containing protein [Syntrophales bacterium]
MFVLLSLGITNGLAYGTTFTIDARDDAGLYPAEPVYLQFVSNGINYPGPATDPGWTHYTPLYNGDPHSVDTYAYNAGISSPWVLQSAGNVWSPDTTVGESLTGLHAGTYRVSPIGSAFEYSFSDGVPPYNKFWWQLSVLGHDVYVNGQLESDYSAIVGSTTPYDTAADALQANMGNYMDFKMAEGGSLTFWIYDWNSIDNSGSLTFNVAPVPEPSTFLLLTVGLAFLIRKIRT